jgi:hypothetical protein
LEVENRRVKKMKPQTQAKLEDAMAYCDTNDKSTEFMIQYMMDSANVSHECVMNFLFKNRDKQENEDGKQ